METIELAVERMRRPRRADGSQRAAPVSPPIPELPLPSSPQSRLPIKTRVLCDYSDEVQAIIGGPAPIKPARGHTLEVAIASAFGGATLVFAAFWLVAPPGGAKPDHPPVAAALAAAAPVTPPHNLPHPRLRSSRLTGLRR